MKVHSRTTTPPNNLPAPLSTFIGRERALADLSHLLSTNRLVTLTGAGGSGKTRLALRVAEELLHGFEHGIWLVELASVFEPKLVSQTVASALNIQEQPGQSLMEVLTHDLAARETLLLMDNCEHLTAACAQVADGLLQKCPGLKILVTSREVLSVTGEAVWIVPPLSLPGQRPWTHPASGQDALGLYEESESVQLFVARARATSPDFELTAENGVWVAEICRQLDGLPLAIELAAARVRSLSVQQIAHRLDDRFHLLTGGSRTAPPRQQTLESTLDWSYALLSASEQRVLQRLSVFAGGATMEAAESVCADEGVQAAEVLDVLSHLVDKSLVTADKPERGETRYSLLETIRQYALGKLEGAGEMEEFKNRHLNYFMRWAEMAEIHLDGPEQLAWLEAYEIEHDNLRAALECCNVDASKASSGLRLAAACGRFWRLRGYLSEGRMHLSAALSKADVQKRTKTRARALTFLANHAYLQSDYPAMRPLAEEALSIWRELGRDGRAGAANTLDLFGELATEEGDYETALLLLAEALEIFRELNDRRGIADMLMQLGWAYMRMGQYRQVAPYMEEALVLFREIGNGSLMAFALAGLGELAIRQEQYERARQVLEESLAIRRAHGHKWGMGAALGSLGWVALRQRDLQRMKGFLEESLSIRVAINDRGGIAWCLEKLAEAKTSQVQFDQATKLFGQAEALRKPIGSVIDPADRQDYDHIVSGLRSTLGEDAFKALWAEGTRMSLQASIELALSVTQSSSGSTRSENEKFGGLTAREREVATLIAQGKSNREIAETMTVGVKTIETYVTRILNKLSFDSRVQIATWAIEKGLKSQIISQ